MKITVTGAVGKLGQFVVKALHAAGHEVIATDQCYTCKLPVRVELLDLCDTNGCYRILEGSDALVHLGNYPGASPLKPQIAYINNVTANVNVFQAARDTGVARIIYASSVQAFSGEQHLCRKDGSSYASRLPYLPLDGLLPPNPGNLYGASKVAGENLLAYYAKFYGLSTVSIRFPSLVDPDQVELDLFRVRRDAVSDEGFTYLALPDAGELIAAVVKAELPGFRVYLPASPGTVLFPMTVEEILARYYPDVPLRAQGKLDNLVDITGITRETGWAPQCRLVGP